MVTKVHLKVNRKWALDLLEELGYGDIDEASKEDFIANPLRYLLPVEDESGRYQQNA